MGRNAQRRRSQRSCRNDEPTTELSMPGDERSLAESLIYDLLENWRSGDPIDRLRELQSLPETPQVLERLIVQAVERAWDIGWQPRDVVRFARQMPGLEPKRFCVAIAVESQSYLDSAVVDSYWRTQLHEIGALDERGPTATSIVITAETLGHWIEVLRWLLWLLPMPRIADPPRLWGRRAGGGVCADGPTRPADAVVAKVRALLAKAESTDYPEEAEALSAKAQELITRYAIDRVLLDANDDDAPIARRVSVDEPYARAKAQLLASVARANRCRSVWSSGIGCSTIVGFDTDVENVELLYSSLLVQATRALAAIGKDAPPGAQERSRAYRRSFLFGFAAQIGHRLHDATARETAEADERHGGSLLPALASRELAVSNRLDELFPTLGQGRASRTTLSDHDGWVAGNAAGKLASLGLDHQVAPHLTA
jgi:hypothetical protein